ncbi:MAG: hypothetical protein IJ880_01890 [Bacilli bacterium]|nr:hypothetical protein [Bacilli bacterium]
MTRYIIKANGEMIGHAETKEKAWKIAHKYEYECANQDEPVTPVMKVEKQTIE